MRVERELHSMKHLEDAVHQHVGEAPQSDDLTIVFLAVAISFISKRKEKGKAGVLYLWSLWAMPAFLPLLVGYIDEVTRPYDSIYDATTRTYITRPAPVHDWIHAHWDLIGYSNMLLIALLLLLLFIPLARRWQAMPEE